MAKKRMTFEDAPHTGHWPGVSPFQTMTAPCSHLAEALGWTCEWNFEYHDGWTNLNMLLKSLTSNILIGAV